MKLERVFEIEKETKNTIRYQEVAEGQPPVIGTIYVQKWCWRALPRRSRSRSRLRDRRSSPRNRDGRVLLRRVFWRCGLSRRLRPQWNRALTREVSPTMGGSSSIDLDTTTRVAYLAASAPRCESGANRHASGFARVDYRRTRFSPYPPSARPVCLPVVAFRGAVELLAARRLGAVDGPSRPSGYRARRRP